MITISKIGGKIETAIAELSGLDKDVANLPVDNIPNSSTFYCMDSGNVYMFDEENKVWIKQDF